MSVFDLKATSAFFRDNPWTQYPILRCIPSFSLTPFQLVLQSQKHRYRHIIRQLRDSLETDEAQSLLTHLQSQMDESLLDHYEYESEHLLLSISANQEYILIFY